MKSKIAKLTEAFKALNEVLAKQMVRNIQAKSTLDILYKEIYGELPPNFATYSAPMPTAEAPVPPIIAEVQSLKANQAVIQKSMENLEADMAITKQDMKSMIDSQNNFQLQTSLQFGAIMAALKIHLPETHVNVRSQLSNSCAQFQV